MGARTGGRMHILCTSGWGRADGRGVNQRMIGKRVNCGIAIVIVFHVRTS